MRVTLNLPDVLIKELLGVAEEKTRSGAIRLAIKDFIRRKKKEKLLSFSSQMRVDLDWDEIEDPELFEAREREKSWRSH
jgi:Bacterial antitoxin of type II TA system, VapB